MSLFATLWTLHEHLLADKSCVTGAIKCIESICQHEAKFRPDEVLKARIRCAQLLLANTAGNEERAQHHLEQANILVRSLSLPADVRLTLFFYLLRVYELRLDSTARDSTASSSGNLADKCLDIANLGIQLANEEGKIAWKYYFMLHLSQMYARRKESEACIQWLRRGQSEALRARDDVMLATFGLHICYRLLWRMELDTLEAAVLEVETCLERLVKKNPSVTQSQAHRVHVKLYVQFLILKFVYMQRLGRASEMGNVCKLMKTHMRSIDVRDDTGISTASVSRRSTPTANDDVQIEGSSDESKAERDRLRRMLWIGQLPERDDTVTETTVSGGSASNTGRSESKKRKSSSGGEMEVMVTSTTHQAVASLVFANDFPMYGVVYLVNVIALRLGDNTMEKADKYTAKGLQFVTDRLHMFEDLKNEAAGSSETRSRTRGVLRLSPSLDSEFRSLLVLKMLFLENSVYIGLTRGNYSKAIECIGKMRSLLHVHYDALFCGFASVLHFCIGLYCLQLQLYDVAVEHFKSLLKLCSDQAASSTHSGTTANRNTFSAELPVWARAYLVLAIFQCGRVEEAGELLDSVEKASIYQYSVGLQAFTALLRAYLCFAHEDYEMARQHLVRAHPQAQKSLNNSQLTASIRIQLIRVMKNHVTNLMSTADMSRCVLSAFNMANVQLQDPIVKYSSFIEYGNVLKDVNLEEWKTIANDSPSGDAGENANGSDDPLENLDGRKDEVVSMSAEFSEWYNMQRSLALKRGAHEFVQWLPNVDRNYGRKLGEDSKKQS